MVYRRAVRQTGGNGLQVHEKGDCIFVIGKMQSRIYKDRQQIERTAHEIIVGEMQIIHTRQPSAAVPTGLPDYL